MQYDTYWQIYELNKTFFLLPIVLRVETAVISSVREWYKFVRNQFAKDLDRKMESNSESEDHSR